LGANLASVCA
jgi:hypothetical protein